MKYKVVIGLEVHCELETNSKVFSGGRNEYSLEPNSNLNPIDLAFPGIMPVPNKKAVDYALKVAMALNCNNPDEIIFDRKNYFYPDLPKGYQITQVTKPMGKNGYVILNALDEPKKVEIHQLHLEEDTASLDHYAGYSLIDYNRSGIPLIEVVTEPCMNSAEEALGFLEELRNIIVYCGVSEAASDKGQMRCDVNVSLMKPDATELGTKVEIKNINSFNNVKEAIEYEIKRQSEMLDNNEKIIMETRRYSDEDFQTYSMREKVEAVDYKYFIEPNIHPVKINQEYLDNIKETLPVLPYERREKYLAGGLSKYDANVLVKDKGVSDYFEKLISLGCDIKKAANWVTTRVLSYVNKEANKISDIYLKPELLWEIIQMHEAGKISTPQARDLFFDCLEQEKEPQVIVKEKGISQITDDSEIRDAVKEVLTEQSESVLKYKEGNERILDFFVGQVMKKTKGKANPSVASLILKEEIEKGGQ